MKTIIHWCYQAGVEIPGLLFNREERQAVCLDEDDMGQALLRALLYKKEIVPTEEMKISCWTVEDTENKHYFFTNDLQNTILKDKSESVCSSL